MNPCLAVPFEAIYPDDPSGAATTAGLEGASKLCPDFPIADCQNRTKKGELMLVQEVG